MQTNCTLSSDNTCSIGHVFAPNEEFLALGAAFGAFHKDPTNVLLHFITTPLGVIGLLSLFRSVSQSTSLLVTLCSIYILSLLTIVPVGEFLGTVILCSVIFYFSRALKLSTLASVAIIVLGYMLQDLAHIYAGEKTFQESYTEGNGQFDFKWSWLTHFGEHAYYLLPLCVHVALPFLPVSPEVSAALKAPLPDFIQNLQSTSLALVIMTTLSLGSYCLDSKNALCFFPGAPYFQRVVQCSILSDDESESKRADLKTVRDWVMERCPPEDQSFHWWFHSLPTEIYKAFDNCAKAPQIMRAFRTLFHEKHYCVDIVEGMNEIYVTGPDRMDESPNSDQIFYTRHVDGPWGVVPFVSVFRCIVGMDANHQITTRFPLAGVDHNALEGDVLAFDFNREVHYITKDPSKAAISDKTRVTLKLHYVVYPRILAPLGWLMHWVNCQYNQQFRILFLRTIHPVSLYDQFLAWNVTINTFIMDNFETFIGQRSMFYLAFVSFLWWSTGNYNVFLLLTSFVHYFRYISTFYVRRGIDFGSFKRDVLVFKTVALAQIIYHYAMPTRHAFELDFVSLGMIATGYAVSMMATAALGIDRTYFGAELGLMEPKWITAFPYGYIPHPMILSQVFALLGFYKAAHFRAEFPYLVPVHCALYIVHMLQEHFEIYKRYPDITTTATTTTTTTAVKSK